MENFPIQSYYDILKKKQMCRRQKPGRTYPEGLFPLEGMKNKPSGVQHEVIQEKSLIFTFLFMTHADKIQELLSDGEFHSNVELCRLVGWRFGGTLHAMRKK